MIFEPEFKFGQKLYAIYLAKKIITKDCHFCRKGEIELKGEKFGCPACGGSRILETQKREKKIIGPCSIWFISFYKNKTIYCIKHKDFFMGTHHCEENMLYSSRAEALKDFDNWKIVDIKKHPWKELKRV